jgi:NAD(P)H-dependent FMN reductase
VVDEPNPAKDRLLRAAVQYVADHGVADLSLRRLAAAIGTSHRMLIYHFGSKEGLLIEVIRDVEEQQRQTLAGFDVDPSLSPAEVARHMWRHLSDPSLWPNERLFFETYGQALQARSHTVDFLDDIVESWLVPIAAMRAAQGLPPDTARAQARLDLAMTRGLLLDLLATGDRAGADAAIEQAITLFETWRAQLPTVPSTSVRDPSDRVGAAAPADERETASTRVLLISGSLRRTSTNTAVLRTAAALAPDGVTTALYDALAALPHFNPDDDVAPLHPAVIELRAQIRRADAVLFSTPEYAGALPGSFKNVLDWTIGDDQPGSIYEKPVAWINTSVRSAADAHDELRRVLGYAHATIIEPACAHIPVASALIGDDDLVHDPTVRDQIARSLATLVASGAGRGTV